MRIILALAVLAASSSAFAEQLPPTREPYRLPLLCNKSGEKISGLTKICYYSCANGRGHDCDDVRGLPALDHTLAVEPNRAIRPKGKFTVVEHAIANSSQDRQGPRHRYPGRRCLATPTK